jgi:hypothetical protein
MLLLIVSLIPSSQRYSNPYHHYKGWYSEEVGRCPLCHAHRWFPHNINFWPFNLILTLISSSSLQRMILWRVWKVPYPSWSSMTPSQYLKSLAGLYGIKVLFFPLFFFKFYSKYKIDNNSNKKLGYLPIKNFYQSTNWIPIVSFYQIFS